MKSVLQDNCCCESQTYWRDARPALYSAVSSTGSHGRNPWMWSLSRALLSRHMLTVIEFPRGNCADLHWKFSYKVWMGSVSALSHTKPFLFMTGKMLLQAFSWTLWCRRFHIVVMGPLWRPLCSQEDQSCFSAEAIPVTRSGSYSFAQEILKAVTEQLQVNT